MADKARISSDELRKAAAETEGELRALLKKSQGKFDFGDPHHVGYTRTNASGTVSTIAAKNPRAVQVATANAKHTHTGQNVHIKETARLSDGSKVYALKTEGGHVIATSSHPEGLRLHAKDKMLTIATDVADPEEQTPDRHALQRNIEQLAAEKGMDPIALISQLQTGAAASGREKLVGLLGAIKNRYIRKQDNEADAAVSRQIASDRAEELSDIANDMNDPVSHEEAAAAHTDAADASEAHNDAEEAVYHRAKAKEHLLAAQTADDDMESAATEQPATSAGEREYDHNGVEAYGQKGMRNTPWRQLFKDADSLHAWSEKNDASVLGTRGLTDSEAHPKSKGGKEQLAAMAKRPSEPVAAKAPSPKAAAKELKSILESADFGYTEAGGNGRVKANADGTLTVYDSFYYGQDEAMTRHKAAWNPGGHNADYFKEQGFDVKVIGTDSELRSKVFGKKENAGHVAVTLAVTKKPPVAKSLREEITSATMLLKSHVKAYQRTTASGASVTVKEHDDSRQKKNALPHGDANAKHWANLPDDENPKYTLSGISSEALSHSVKGKDDLNRRAKVELANRGLDSDGKWIGFDKADQHHGLTEEEKGGDPDGDEVSGHLQLAHNKVLSAAAKGHLDLNKRAKHELANRGHDSNGKWIGFDAAEKHHGVK
jgi:hypothetical protein